MRRGEPERPIRGDRRSGSALICVPQDTEPSWRLETSPGAPRRHGAGADAEASHERHESRHRHGCARWDDTLAARLVRHDSRALDQPTAHGFE